MLKNFTLKNPDRNAVTKNTQTEPTVANEPNGSKALNAFYKNMQKITNLYILSLQDVEFSQNQTSSLLSTKVQQKKICQLLFFLLFLI